MGNIVSVIMVEKEFDRKMKMLRVKISKEIAAEFWECGLMWMWVTLIGKSSADTQLISTHTCAGTQPHRKPYCNLYRYFDFRCYSRES
jgi:hypothetical protein